MSNFCLEALPISLGGGGGKKNTQKKERKKLLKQQKQNICGSKEKSFKDKQMI